MLTPPTNDPSAANGATGASASAGASGSAPDSAAEAASQELGKNDFLQLLVAQLSNQDPTNPMEGREFAAQLAQFTSVEQLTNISDQIEAQQGANDTLSQSINSGVATDLIGRTIEAQGNQVTWSGEGDKTLSFNLGSPASEVKITIRSAAGTPVRTRTLDDLSAGPQEIEWSGTNNDGDPLPQGTYTFDVQAADADGNPVNASTFLRGTVDRVTFGQDGTLLWVDGTKVSMGNVRSVAAE